MTSHPCICILTTLFLCTLELSIVSKYLYPEGHFAYQAMASIGCLLFFFFAAVVFGSPARVGHESQGLQHYHGLEIQSRSIQTPLLALSKRGHEPFKQSDSGNPGTSTEHSQSGANTPSKDPLQFRSRTGSPRHTARQDPSTSNLPLSSDDLRWSEIL